MHRLKSSLLILLLAALGVAQTASDTRRDAVKTAGSKLACLCGGCKNTVADCPMIGCHYAHPARDEIRKMAAAGASDKEIIDFFIKREGIRALAEPPAEGFNVMARLMPIIAVMLGLWITWYFLRRFRRMPAPAGVANLDDSTYSRYRDRIEQDLEKLD